MLQCLRLSTYRNHKVFFVYDMSQSTSQNMNHAHNRKWEKCGRITKFTQLTNKSESRSKTMNVINIKKMTY